VLPLPIDGDVKRTFFIICSCPVASVVLNYAEIIGEGQREAANTVLLGTILSIVTLPIMMLLMPLL
jgi:predicted permease